VGKPEGDYLEDLAIDEMILKWMFKRSVGWFWTADSAQVWTAGGLLRTR